MRSDTKRNRRELVEAAGALFASKRGPINMADIAKHANISTATAYRHFASVDDVLAEFNYSVGHKLLVYSLEQTSSGLTLLEAVSAQWVALVLKHGRGMPYSRSGEGYIARLRQATFYLTVQAEALARPLSEACTELDIEASGEEAMFLWNLFFDPREIVDLVDTAGFSQQQTTSRLLAALRGALVGWTGSSVVGDVTSTEATPTSRDNTGKADFVCMPRPVAPARSGQ